MERKLSVNENSESTAKCMRANHTTALQNLKNNAKYKTNYKVTWIKGKPEKLNYVTNNIEKMYDKIIYL